MTAKISFLASLAVVIVLASSSMAVADTFTASASEEAWYSLITPLKNATGDDGNGECAATSLVNSFQYLRRATRAFMTTSYSPTALESTA